ncbi:putative late blight resistance protein homolog R1C-3 [Solanum verrucosum]|uniref:putative late blight resistance protein homolog R1C-3 n=1 Tax=Solanum verrucosum TaxID=315347 RepID=UPI0020D1BA94|nr:putative late blight resistance protein homolog R1C-3 [Solanum verrucosum]
MERGKENEGQTKGEDNKSLVSSRVVLGEDIVNLLDFIERLNSGRVRTFLDMDQIEKLTLRLTFLSAFCHLYYTFFLESCNDEMSNEIHDLVQSLFHPSGVGILVTKEFYDLLENIRSYISSHIYAEPSRVTTMTADRFVELLDAILMYLQRLLKCCSESIFPSMTQYELLQNVIGNLRDFHRLKVNGCVEYETIEYVLPHLQLMALRVVNFCCFTLWDYRVDTFYGLDDSLVDSKLANLLVEVIPVELEVMHICCTNLKGSKLEEVGLFIKQLVEASPDILRESLIHIQQHMVNALTPSASTYTIHVMIEFLLIILTDVLKDVIRHDKLFVLLARVIELTKEVFVLVRNLEENMNETSDANQNLLESIEFLKEDLKYSFLKARADSSQLCFPMSDGPLFMTLLLTNLNNLVNSNAYSVSLIKEEIGLLKEDLEIIRSFFGYVEQELHRDLWTRFLDVAYEAQHGINSILARDHGLLQLIFILPDTIEKIMLVKREVQEKILKSSGIIVANVPNKLVERNSSSTVGKIIVGFEEETEWIIRKLTSGPAEIDVISIVGMPGIGKTTMAYRVYNDKSIVDHFDVCAWCTVDQERNEKKLLQKIFNQVIGLKERFSEDDIDDDVADNLRKNLCGKRYLIVLDDLWDTATLEELTRPFPEFRKGSRVILTSRKKEVALHGKYHSDPLYLQLLKSEESWELLEKKVFGEERCPDELKDVGKMIARKCDGLPLVLDLIGGVISRKEKKEALWLEVLNNLSSFIFKDEEEVVKFIQLSYDHLADHVKPCFICLARYPKGEDIMISELKDLWISHGFVQQIEMRSAEEVVDELISSSLVIPFDNSICKIQDLVHDFCYIKYRKEKLFDFIGGSNDWSSSGMMARGITIRYDQRLFDLDEDNKSLVSSRVVLREDIDNLLDFIERLNSGRVRTSLDIEELTLKLTFVSAVCGLYYSLFLESCNDEMSCISNEIHDLVQSLFHPSGVDMLVNIKFFHLLENIRRYISSHSYVEPSRVTTMTEDRFVELLDAIHMYLPSLLKFCSESIFPSMTQHELLQNVFGNLRDFHRLKVNSCVEYEIIEYVLPHLQLMALRVVNFCCSTIVDLSAHIHSKLDNLLVEVIPVELEVMHICCTNLKGSKSEEVERFIKQLLEASPDILRESLIHLQEHMVNAGTPRASTCNIHVMIEFLLIILNDVLKDVIRHDKLFVLLARVIELTKEVFVLVHNLEENMNEASDANLNLLENIELLKTVFGDIASLELITA